MRSKPDAIIVATGTGVDRAAALAVARQLRPAVIVADLPVAVEPLHPGQYNLAIDNYPPPLEHLRGVTLADKAGRYPGVYMRPTTFDGRPIETRNQRKRRRRRAR